MANRVAAARCRADQREAGPEGVVAIPSPSSRAVSVVSALGWVYQPGQVAGVDGSVVLQLPETLVNLVPGPWVLS